MTTKQEAVYDYVKKQFYKDYYFALKSWDMSTVGLMEDEGFYGWDRFSSAVMDGMLLNGYSVQSVDKMLKDPNAPIIRAIEERDNAEVEGRKKSGMTLLTMAFKSFYEI